jgi:hypothetical protein
VVLHLTRVEQPPAETAAAQQEASSWRLPYLHALALLESGEIDEARRQLSQLYREFPDQSELLAALARAEQRRGAWSEALPLYAKTAALQPDDAASRSARDQLWQRYGSQVNVEFGWRDAKHADEQAIQRIDGRWRLDSHTGLVASVERRDVDAAGLPRPSGTPEDVAVTRTAGELGAQRDWDTQMAQALLLINPDSLGAKFAYESQRSSDQIAAHAIYQERYFEYVEGIVDDATRSRLDLGYQRTFNARWRGGIGASLNDFEMSHVGHVGRSIGLTASLQFLAPCPIPLCAVVYRIDSEQVSDVATRTTDMGDTYQPLPLADREVHALGVEFGDWDNRQLQYSVSAGYSVDRNGADSPYAAAQVAVRPQRNLTVGLRGSYSLAADPRYDSAVSYMAVLATYHFDSSHAHVLAPRNGN